jgi:hemolysin activation/secretion protein
MCECFRVLIKGIKINKFLMKTLVRRIIGCGVYILVSTFIFLKPAGSQTTSNPAVEQQRLETQESSRQIEDRFKAFEKTVFEIPKEEVPPQEVPEEIRFLIKHIVVTGNSAVSDTSIREITSPYEDREMTLAEAKTIARKITTFYRIKGYVTSIAYVPPQKFDQETLEIKILEGTLGHVKVQGNKFFKTENLLRPVKKLTGQVLEYGEVKKGLIAMNAHPDREVKAVILPGQMVGTSDLVLDVKDHLPIHVGAEINNFGTKLTGKNRYGVTMTDNNLLGQDDILAARFQWGREVTALSTQYVRPVGDNGMEMGATFSYTDAGVGGEFKDLDINGKAYAYSLFLNRPLFTLGIFDFTGTGAFESMTVRNTVLDQLTSRDKLRMLHTGLNFDETDAWGKCIGENEFIFGVPWLGSSEKNDPLLSRAGAGANFMKFISTLYRLQPIHDSTLLYIKAFGQWTPDRLLSAEQMDIGGIYSVRGYPQSDFLGDTGIGTNIELRIPFYFIARDVKVPGTQEPLWNRLSFVIFFDSAHARIKDPSASDVKSRSYTGMGAGFRIALPHNLTARLEAAAPLGDRPSDDSRGQFYFSISGNFF